MMTVDYESISGDFKRLCFRAGGKIYVIDLVADCTAENLGTTYNADFTFLNYPNCVGLNCTADELDTTYSNEIYPLLENFTASFNGLTCDISDKNEMIVVTSAAVTSSRLFYPSIVIMIGVMASVMIASV